MLSFFVGLLLGGGVGMYFGSKESAHIDNLLKDVDAARVKAVAELNELKAKLKGEGNKE